MAAQLPVMEVFAPFGEGDLRADRRCAPLQQNLLAIPTIELEISERDADADAGEVELYQRYQDHTEKRLRRLLAIGPGTYYGKPITPGPNPANFPQRPHLGHSYHRVVLTCRTRPTYRVELLIRDFDLYLLGFRRELHEVWSPWYYCKDELGFPPFLADANNEELDFDGGHEIKGNMGGGKTLHSIFNTLGKYPEQRDFDKMKKSFLQAVVLFSEAMRFRYILAELVKRIRYGLAESPVDIPRDNEHEELPAGKVWKQVGSWVVFSRLALRTGLENGVINTRRAMKDYATIYLINGFQAMLNCLKVLKTINVGLLSTTGLNVAYGMGVGEPGFIELHEVYP